MTLERDHLPRAIIAMRTALDLLDRAGEQCAAAHLQHAISIAEREPLPPAIQRD